MNVRFWPTGDMSVNNPERAFDHDDHMSANDPKETFALKADIYFER